MSPEHAEDDTLVDAAIDVMIEDPTALLDRGLSTDRICDRAHYGRATFYRRYRSKELFIAAVLDGLVRGGALDGIDVNSTARAVLAAHQGDVRRSVHFLASEYFADADDLTDTNRRLLAAVFAPGRAQLVHKLRDGYHRLDATMLDVFDALVGSRGVTFRKPFSANRLSLILIALVEGMLLRKRVDPGSVSPQLVADAILAVTGSILNTEDEQTHIYDRLGPLAPNSGAESPMPREPRAAIIAAAREEFERRGYFSSSLDTIADEAGVPKSVARQIFPTKAHIIVGALRTKYAELAEAIDDDMMIYHDDVEPVVASHLERCAQLVAQETVYMDALIAVVAHDTYSEPDGMLAIKQELDFPALLEPVVQRGQRNGHFNSALPSRDVAALVTDTLLLRCFTRRSLAPETNAAFVSSLVLDGLRTR